MSNTNNPDKQNPDNRNPDKYTSEPHPSDRSSGTYIFEPWHLTAYALDELDDSTRASVDAWLVQHPEGHKEVEATRLVADRVEQELGRLPEGLELDPARASRIQEAIASTHSEIGFDGIQATEVSLPSPDSMPDSMLGANSSVSKRNRRRRFLMVLATGAAAGLGGFAFWANRHLGDRLRTLSAKMETPASSIEKFESPLGIVEHDDGLSQVDPLVRGRSSSTGGNPVVGEPMGLSSRGTLNGAADKLSYNAPDKALMSRLQEGEAERELVEEVEQKVEQREKQQASELRFSKDSLGKNAEKTSDFLRMPSGYGLGSGLGAGLAIPDSPRGGLEVSPKNEFMKGATQSDSKTDLSLGLEKNKLAERGTAGKGTEGEVLRDREFPDELLSNVPSRRKENLDSGRAAGDRSDSLPETPFESVLKEPLSTFSIDVDTASYSKLRQYVLENKVVPPPATIRIEEWLNYFDYGYPGPVGDDPFAAHLRMGDCPWNAKHKLVRVAIQAKKVANEDRPNSNLVFLIDVSGSMADANKLPLVKRTLGLLLAQLRPQDRVAIVVYAGAAGCVLPSTGGDRKDQILASIDELQSGGSTNGGQGIELAYKIAKENFIPGGVNRVVLCTDGDFNVGVTGTPALVSMMQEQAKSNVFLTCLGYGIGNYNDSMMEQVSNQGNGTYAMVDSEIEARRVMTEQLSGTLMTVAKDVKIQVEFNPAKVHSYRLIGYENRRLAAADFNNDKKDAGEIGAGHRVTALYEIVPVGQEGTIPGSVDDLRYAKGSAESPRAAAGLGEASNEWMFLKIRSKRPESSESTKQEFALGEVASQRAYEGEQGDYDWATSVAEFGLLMRRSELAPEMQWEKMLGRAMDSAGQDAYRRECILIMQRARDLMGK
jgi:Ca-activated chloride channel family protein